MFEYKMKVDEESGEMMYFCPLCGEWHFKDEMILEEEKEEKFYLSCPICSYTSFTEK